MPQDEQAAPVAPDGEPRLWKVVTSFVATEQQHDEITDRFVEVLCPDPNHPGPCAIPWAQHTIDGDSLSRAERNRLRAEIADTMDG